MGTLNSTLTSLKYHRFPSIILSFQYVIFVIVCDIQKHIGYSHMHKQMCIYGYSCGSKSHQYQANSMAERKL